MDGNDGGTGGATARPVTFGIKTTPMHVEYDDILRVWQEADEIPEIADAWLWDHLLPMAGPKDGPVHEGWTLLSALAAQTRRLGLGLLVTSNRLRHPALLGKMAATVDTVARGRLVMGLGVGGTRQPPGAGGVPGPNPALAEYEAYGLDLVSPGEGIARLDEAVTIIRRLWTEDAPFDFEGRHYRLRGALCVPKPVRRPGPPILIGGWGPRTLRLVAAHADIWNVPGPPHNTVADAAARNRALDAACAALDRDPATLGRSVQLIVSYDNLPAARTQSLDLIHAGFDHIVLALPRGYPQGIARRLTHEVINPVRAQFP
jgi:alkanesulfonate monooxygenase SsuD/methylene tetrahydromethanopterin reductase-like flavin-dependent oxidoreductase (luciferase family)